jgi:hypothetical protein
LLSIRKVCPWLPGLLLAATIAHAQVLAHPSDTGSISTLPDAPQPASQSTSFQSTPPGKPAPGTAGSVDHASYQMRKWAQYVDPGEHVPRLNARDKMLFWLHEESRPSAALPAFVSAGYGQITNNDPKFGTDSGAFGQRLGAILIRQASMRFFSSSLIPTLDGEDPRYFRKAAMSPARAGLPSSPSSDAATAAAAPSTSPTSSVTSPLRRSRRLIIRNAAPMPVLSCPPGLRPSPGPPATICSLNSGQTCSIDYKRKNIRGGSAHPPQNDSRL